MSENKYKTVDFGTAEAVFNKLGGLDGIAAFLRGEIQIVYLKLLEFVGTVETLLMTGKFIAKDKFVKNTDKSTAVNISHLSDNFRNWFLAGDGKIEEIAGPHPKLTTELRYGKLIKDSLDAPIITELGGETKAETTLAEVYSLMEKQGKGEEGALLTNGYWNIFYVKDIKGVLRAVHVVWLGGGWDVSADSVGIPGRWSAGDQVFSRNS